MTWQTSYPGTPPVPELTTRWFWAMAFPSCFDKVDGCYCIKRKRLVSFADWVEHKMWWHDGRFARHPILKFVLLNVKNKQAALSSASFFLKQKAGNLPDDSKALLDRIKNNDNSLLKDVMFYSGTITGTPQYWWRQRGELNAFVDYSTHVLQTPPSFFNTLSCAENHWKPLTMLLHDFCSQVDGKEVADLILPETTAKLSCATVFVPRIF